MDFPKIPVFRRAVVIEKCDTCMQFLRKKNDLKTKLYTSLNVVAHYILLLSLDTTVEMYCELLILPSIDTIRRYMTIAKQFLNSSTGTKG